MSPDDIARHPPDPAFPARRGDVSSGPLRRVGPVRIESRTGRRGAAGPARRPGRGGRGLRGHLAPVGVPLHRTRGEEFDDLVMDAVDELEEHWATELAGLEFAVEEVPTPAEGTEFDPDVVLDRDVPLGRLYRDGLPGIPQ